KRWVSMPLLFAEGMAFGVLCPYAAPSAPKVKPLKTPTAAPKASTRVVPRSIIRVSVPATRSAPDFGPTRSPRPYHKVPIDCPIDGERVFVGAASATLPARVSPRLAGNPGTMLSFSFAAFAAFATFAARFALAALATLAAALAVAVFSPRVARADTPSTALDGPWNMTAVVETFTVQQWSPTCGPAPVTGTGQPGGVVRVRTDGAEFAIEGGRRTLRSDGCVDGMSTLASEAHSSDGRSWRTRCSTPPSDPRRATVNTAYFLTGDDTLQLAETGRYELTINAARCIADVKREASLRKFAAVPAAASAATSPGGRARIETGGPSPASPAGASGPAKPDCSAPGRAARLEVRPSRKLLRTGDTFGFWAVVVDASGCPTGTAIQWALGAMQFKEGQAHARVPTIDAAGKLAMPADCPDATFEVVATAAGRSARASVDVTSPANYEALVAQSGLGPSGEREEPAIAV